jgi:hypothetical protein
MNKKGSVLVIIMIVVIVLLAIGVIWHYLLYQKVMPISQENISSSTVGVNEVATSSSTNHLPLYLEYAIGGTNYLSITTPNGKQYGEDPITGIKYTDFNNGGENDSNPNETFLYVEPPIAGEYIIKVGGPSGAFELGSFVADGIHPPIPQTVTGTISQSIPIITYIQNYNPNNLASSTLILQVATSSL